MLSEYFWPKSEYFRTPIKSSVDAKVFLTKLHNDNLLYHPDDSAHDIISLKEGRRFCDEKEGDCFESTFTSEEADELDFRMSEVFEVYDDPYQFILDNLND